MAHSSDHDCFCCGKMIPVESYIADGRLDLAWALWVNFILSNNPHDPDADWTKCPAVKRVMKRLHGYHTTGECRKGYLCCHSCCGKLDGAEHKAVHPTFRGAYYAAPQILCPDPTCKHGYVRVLDGMIEAHDQYILGNPRMCPAGETFPHATAP